MYVAVKNLPGYVLEQTGEISQTRAENEGRKGEPTFGDMVKALPAAAVSAWMEKIGTSKMLGLDDVALTELKQLPNELFKTLLTEGATEAAQEAAMIGGEQAFTNKGIDWWQAMERVAQSALVGSIFGPAVKAPIAGVQIATAPGKEEEVVEPAADTEGQSTPQQPAGKPQGPESGVEHAGHPRRDASAPAEGCRGRSTYRRSSGRHRRRPRCGGRNRCASGSSASGRCDP